MWQPSPDRSQRVDETLFSPSFHTQFPGVALPEARQIWMAMENQFLSRYNCFLGVWLEWYSSGI